MENGLLILYLSPVGFHCLGSLQFVVPQIIVVLGQSLVFIVVGVVCFAGHELLVSSEVPI